MLNSIQIGDFIMGKRKALGLTQQQLAYKLNISFQAVSKWEHGIAFPNMEILKDLAMELGGSGDEILDGSEKDEEGFSYSRAGGDIAYTDTMKKEMSGYLQTKDRRVLNALGAFASLYDFNFPGMEHPVLAVASNGLHTNGYSLVRLLMDKMPHIKLEKIDGMTFIEQIMKPHTPYYKAVKGLLGGLLAKMKLPLHEFLRVEAAASFLLQ